MSKKQLQWRMTLNEEQFNVIIKCVETCHRIACGQVEELRTVLPRGCRATLIQQIKEESFPELDFGESYDWQGGYAEGYKRAKNEPYMSEDVAKAFDTFQTQTYQIYRKMREKQALADKADNPNRSYDIYCSETLTTGKAKQPIIELINE